MSKAHDEEPLPTVLHQNLIHLGLDDIPSHTWGYMCCPRLRNLEVNLVDYRLANGPIEFLLRSQCSSESLILTEDLGRMDDLMQLLEITPTLEWLTVSTIGEDLLQRLVDTTYYSEISKEPRFLPKLRCFHYNGPRTFAWSYIPAIAPMESPNLSEMLRRPLSFVAFFLELEEGDTEFVDRSSLDDIIKTIDAGIELYVHD